MNRRGLLQLLGLTATSTMAPLVSDLNPDDLDRVISAIATPGRVDENVVAHIEEVLTTAIANDSQLGPQAAFPLVLAQCDLIQKMLPECPDQLRPRLLSALSNAFRLAGWLSFDSNDFTNAWRYYEQARATAHQAQDPEITAFILANMSHVATWTGKPHAGVDHGIAARTWAAKTENLSVRIFVSDRAALACSAAGDYGQCMRELDNANIAIASLDTRPPSALYHHEDTVAMHTAKRGECLLRLGRTSDAINVINESLALYDPSSVRGIALAKLSLGKALIHSTDIDEAAKVVATVADLTTQNRSARLIKELRTTREAMRPWQETRPVKQLDDHLAGYGLG